MRAHGEDLRAETADAGLAEAVQRDWRTAPLDARQRAMCEYAEKLTRAPREMTAADLEPLRAAGLSDAAILDAVEVIGYFNYANRVADALGVQPEPEWQPRAE